MQNLHLITQHIAIIQQTCKSQKGRYANISIYMQIMEEQKTLNVVHVDA